MPDTMLGWGQMGLYAAGALGILMVAVGQLFKTMASSYGGIIAAMQKESEGQQAQINTLRAEAAIADRKCNERLKALEQSHIQNTKVIREIQQKQEA